MRVGVEAVSPDGTRWRVGRVWWQGRPRWRRRLEDVGGDGGFPDLGGDDLAGLALAVVLGLLLLLVVPFLLPAVVFAVELVLLLLLGGLALAARVLLVRPWTVRATSATGQVVTRQARGWRASGRAVEELAASVRAGRLT